MLRGLQSLLAKLPWVTEIEINPVILRSEAPVAVAVDAVVLMDDTEPLLSTTS